VFRDRDWVFFFAFFFVMEGFVDEDAAWRAERRALQQEIAALRGRAETAEIISTAERREKLKAFSQIYCYKSQLLLILMHVYNTHGDATGHARNELKKRDLDAWWARVKPEVDDALDEE
jgi:hypothetical protein